MISQPFPSTAILIMPSQMRVRAVQAACLLLLLSVKVFTSETFRCTVSGLSRQLHGTEVVVGRKPLVGAQWSFSPANKELPLTRQIFQAGAAFIAVDFQRLVLLPGDSLVVRDPSRTAIAIATAHNASSFVQTRSTKSSLSLVLWAHPFLVHGDTLVIEYFPSVMTVMLANQSDGAMVELDSFIYGVSNMPMFRSASKTGNESLSSGLVQTESTVGSVDEAKEAVCYRKSDPKVYAKARAVARLMIRNKQSTRDQAFEQSTWVFCTGWLIGRGNYLLTNHHCVKEAEVIPQGESASQTQVQGEGILPNAIPNLWPHRTISSNTTGQEVEAVVGFMAETKRCCEAGFMGERVGVVEATRAIVVATHPELDYALLRLLVNSSATNLDRKYGYLRLRATGPVDGEKIYIPQHPRGEPKEIATTKNGKPAIIEAANVNSSSISFSGYHDSQSTDTSPMVLYNADTEPGSSGSPVLSRKDNTVVALHRAGSSENSRGGDTAGLFNVGIRADLIAEDLQQRNALPPGALVS